MTNNAPIDVTDLFGVKDLVAVVTGGGSGIGLMIAQALEANGAIVYILGRRKETLDKTASTSRHGNIKPIQADVTNKKDLERAVEELTAAHGFVNVVIANSGITGPGLEGLPANPSLSQFREKLWSTSSDEFTNTEKLWSTSSDEFTNTFAVNNTGVFNTVAAFLELLDAGNKRGHVQQRSQVIATASVASFNRQPLAGYAYSSSKAGVVHLMKVFSTALVPYDIRSNIIAPGFYPSEMTEGLLTKQGDKPWPKSVIPEERPGDIQDMAGAVLFLVSRAGGYINGNVLLTDGGRVAVVPSSSSGQRRPHCLPAPQASKRITVVAPDLIDPPGNRKLPFSKAPGPRCPRGRQMQKDAPMDGEDWQMRDAAGSNGVAGPQPPPDQGPSVNGTTSSDEEYDEGYDEEYEDCAVVVNFQQDVVMMIG
ncbi:Short-chain dehydrogenase/reductase VdtF like protein [Verticillium longisporum]|nr:Short-chain dehydrogenase/reductase VdtF like protein [Verticillium longisporum]